MSTTTRGIKQDRARRSKEGWERGKGAPKKGNPRYQPKRKCYKKANGKKVCTKVYVLRKRK